MVCCNGHTAAAVAYLALADRGGQASSLPNALQTALTMQTPLFVHDIGQGVRDNAHAVVEGCRILRFRTKGFALAQ